MIFRTAPKMNKSEKKGRRCEKRIGTGRFGGTPVLPEELLEFAKSEDSSDLQRIWDTLSPASREGAFATRSWESSVADS